MQRTVVQIARVRMADLRRGDVINAKPDADQGWFMVQTMRQLPSGELVAGGASASGQGAAVRPVWRSGHQTDRSQLDARTRTSHRQL